MKRDINFVFLALVALLLMSMVGMALYYGSTYQGLNSEYLKALETVGNKSLELNKTIEVLNAKNEDLDKKKALLVDIIDRLNLSKERDFQWENIYLDAMQKKDQLEEEKSNLRGTLVKTENERMTLNSNLTQCRIEYQGEENKRRTAENNLNLANAQISELAKKNTNLKQDINSADEKTGSISTTIENIDNRIDTISRGVRALEVTENETDKKDDLEGDIDRLSSTVNDLKKRIEELSKIISRMKNYLG